MNSERKIVEKLDASGFSVVLSVCLFKLPFCHRDNPYSCSMYTYRCIAQINRIAGGSFQIKFLSNRS